MCVVATLDAIPHNLPLHLTSFVGREREIAAYTLLLGEARLLTLTGTGGAGKTRLALQVAARVVEHYPDGVWVADLAPLADAALVPQTVAMACGVTETAGRPVLEALIAAWRSRRVLLVLDNCEHLLQASAQLAHGLLQALPACLHPGHEPCASGNCRRDCAARPLTLSSPAGRGRGT